MNILNKTLFELEKTSKVEEVTPLISKINLAMGKLLNDLTVEDIRLLIGQQIGLHYLVPIALGILKENPLAEGDFYPGDLLNTVLRINTNFWNIHAESKSKIVKILKIAKPLIESQLPDTRQLSNLINEFEKTI